MNFLLRAQRSPKVRRLLLLLAALLAAAVTPSAAGHASARPADSPPSGPSVEPVLAWQLEMDVPAPPAGLAASATADSAKAQLESVLASKLTGSDTSRTVEATTLDGQPGYQVSLQGQTDDAHLRLVLFGSLSPEFDVLGGPMEVAFTGHAHGGQTLTVTLESRPGTGYGWEIAPDNTALVTSVGDFTVRQKGQSLGGPATTTVVLQSAADLDSTVRLVYRRSWETQATITRHLSLQAAAWPDSLDLTSPLPPPTDLAAASTIQDSPPVTTQDGLPTSWDWRPQLTPIRNQGGCGSCWAFGTVGVLESAIRIYSGVSTNLSEQFLLSCNTYGYECEHGGWWYAHNFHTNTLGKSQTHIGAVLESDMPYTASDGSCTTDIANHPYRQSAWYWVPGGSIPTPDQIKNAIYAHGPVGASVCVGSAFQGYRSSSGVFATDESAACGSPGATNHAIVLVGWNDNDGSGHGYWILRNSWGTGWGQSGYMYIRWGTSSVGSDANYVVFIPSNLNDHVYLPYVSR